MKKDLTRRQLAGVMLTAATVAAQTPAATASNPAEELEAARGQNHRSSEALAKVPLPMDTEPAFHFNA